MDYRNIKRLGLGSPQFIDEISHSFEWELKHTSIKILTPSLPSYQLMADKSIQSEKFASILLDFSEETRKNLFTLIVRYIERQDHFLTTISDEKFGLLIRHLNVKDVLHRFYLIGFTNPLAARRFVSLLALACGKFCPDFPVGDVVDFVSKKLSPEADSWRFYRFKIHYDVLEGAGHHLREFVLINGQLMKLKDDPVNNIYYPWLIKNIIARFNETYHANFRKDYPDIKQEAIRQIKILMERLIDQRALASPAEIGKVEKHRPRGLSSPVSNNFLPKKPELYLTFGIDSDLLNRYQAVSCALAINYSSNSWSILEPPMLITIKSYLESKLAGEFMSRLTDEGFLKVSQAIDHKLLYPNMLPRQRSLLLRSDLSL